MSTSLLSDLASTLTHDGDTARAVCPFCNGGSTNEKSLQITRDGVRAKFICHRASCPAQGSYTYGGVPSNHTAARSPRRAVKGYEGACSKLPVPYLQYMRSTYGIQPALMHKYGCKKTEDGRILFPILNPRGVSRGDNVRYYSDLAERPPTKYMPKSMIYRIGDSPTIISWHRLGVDATTGERSGLAMPDYHSKLLIIVEDQVSAIKASRMVDAVALLGTAISMDKIAEISREMNEHKYYDKVAIMLDADAYSQALKHMRRTHALFSNVHVRRLEKDIKDMTYPEIKELLKEYNDDA